MSCMGGEGKLTGGEVSGGMFYTRIHWQLIPWFDGLWPPSTSRAKMIGATATALSL